MNVHSAYQQVRSFVSPLLTRHRDRTPRVGGPRATEPPATCAHESLEPRLFLQAEPVPTLSVSAFDAVATEDGDPAVFRIAVDEVQAEPITARFTLGGSARRNQDYELLVGGLDGTVFTGNTVTLPAGDQFVSVIVRPVDDSVLENTETVNLALVNDGGYRLASDGDQRSATATIEDNEPTLSVAAQDPQAAEEGLDPGTFRITREGAPDGPVMAAIRVGGSARRDVDYALTANGSTVQNNTVLIPSGQTFVDVTVEPLDDMVVERTETVVLSLANTREYRLTDDPTGRAATVELLDNEPTVTLVATDGEAGETGPDIATFQITRQDTRQGDLPVGFALGGSARRNRDYDLLVGDEVITGNIVTIPEGQTTVTLVVRPIDDFLVERDETVVIALRGSRQYVLSEDPSLRRAEAVIADDESAVSIVATDAEAGEEGPSTASFEIARDGTTVGDLAVRFRTGGNARRGLDYDLLVGGEVLDGNTVIIPEGQSSVTVVLQPIDDDLVEPTETVVLSVVNTPNYRLPEDRDLRSASATIEDNEPTLSIMTVEEQASEEGPEPAVFRIMREGSNQLEVVANLRMNGSAANGRDVQMMVNGEPVENHRVTLPAGQDAVDVMMVPVDDNIVEPTKTMTVALRPSRNHRLSEDGSARAATAELTDNEPTVAVAAMDAEASEPGTNQGTFRIAREGSVQGPLDVAFAIGGNARRNRDYELVVNDEVLTGNTVTIPDGENIVDVIVRPLDDTAVEQTESVILVLRNTRAYVLADDPTLLRATVEIADDEPTLSLAVVDEEAGEEGPDAAAFRIDRAGSTAEAVQARIRVGGNARRNVDYELLVDGQVVSATSVTVTVRPIDDNLVENDETITLALLNGRDYKLAEDRDQLSGSATLTDNEPTVSVSAIDTDAGEQGPNPAAFRVSREGSTQGPLDVTFRLRGNARLGQDYDLIAHGEPVTGNTVTIPDGNTFVDVTMTPIDDDLVEPTETAVFDLVNTNRYVLTDDVEQRTVTVEIADNEPVLSVQAIDEQAGEAGLNQGVFRIIREGAREQPVTVRFRLNGSATRNRDYQLTVGGSVLDGNTVTIPAGQGFVDVTLEPIDDDQVEMREMVTLTVVNGSGYVLVADPSLRSDSIEIADNDTNAQV